MQFSRSVLTLQHAIRRTGAGCVWVEKIEVLPLFEPYSPEFENGQKNASVQAGRFAGLSHGGSGKSGPDRCPDAPRSGIDPGRRSPELG